LAVVVVVVVVVAFVSQLCLLQLPELFSPVDVVANLAVGAAVTAVVGIIL